jgi:hypothetical protein
MSSHTNLIVLHVAMFSKRPPLKMMKTLTLSSADSAIQNSKAAGPGRSGETDGSGGGVSIGF